MLLLTAPRWVGCLVVGCSFRCNFAMIEMVHTSMELYHWVAYVGLGGAMSGGSYTACFTRSMEIPEGRSSSSVHGQELGGERAEQNFSIVIPVDIGKYI